MNKYALTVENLTKVYSNSKNKKQDKALNDLSFEAVSYTHLTLPTNREV